MSYHIEYQWHAFRIEASCFHDGQTRFIVAVEGGDNNVYYNRNGRRVRDWTVCMIGTARGVLMQAVRRAGACEGGMLKPGGKDCRPEAYIARIRRLIEAEQPRAAGRWYPRVRISEEHRAVAYLRDRGFTLGSESRYGETRATVEAPSDHLTLPFELIDRFPDLMGWQLARVDGLPSS